MSEPYGVIYMLLNKINGKVYIGQTVSFIKRMNRYRQLHCKGQPYLYGALIKHGWDNFDKLILDTCYTDKFDLTVLEQFYMDKFNSLDKDCGYNGREADLRGRLSEETKAKISEAISGEKHWNFGKHLSEETKARMSEAHKGEKNYRFGKRGGPSPHFGKRHSEETKIKLSKANKGKTVSAETKAKMTESARHKMKPVECMETGQVFESEMSCSRIMNISQGHLHDHLKGKHKHVKGLHFRYFKKDNNI